MILRPPISTRNDTLLPYTTLFRSEGGLSGDLRAGRRAGERNGREGEAPAAQLAAERYAHDFHFLGSPLTAPRRWPHRCRSEEHTSELQSLMRTSYAAFCLQQQQNPHQNPRRPPPQHTHPHTS